MIPAAAPDYADSEIQRLHDMGAGVLVMMQYISEHRGRRMQARQTARRMREQVFDWAALTSATGIVE